MNEYLFLFGLAFTWIIFAVVQDMRSREVANWLNFSLIAFVLAYRAFYSIFSREIMFFIYGLIGVLSFVILGYAFYYARAFAGGDAKLLMGLGGVLPFDSFITFGILTGGFFFLLFSLGIIYSLTYTIFLATKNKKTFIPEFKKQLIKNKKYIFIALLIVLIIEISAQIISSDFLGLSAILIIIIPLLFIYSKAIENSCMIKLLSPNKLTEGDWLEKEILINGRKIKKSIHGLTEREIILLRKHNKKVWIKEGIPFTPAFLMAFVFGLCIWLRYSPF
ncbi:hypothetical protein COU60_04630 [Candidatus Pacearchaeota archaeon CG10_big_fil_rev_8_21_14_0_10_34_76]|nr:MAG: hypothetical protein COU60_04630 [Candidatus Pacearchaeota archaeon CG10_big_fil_rev_8_21_14_0_10_34_76]